METPTCRGNWELGIGPSRSDPLGKGLLRRNCAVVAMWLPRQRHRPVTELVELAKSRFIGVEAGRLACRSAGGGSFLGRRGSFVPLMAKPSLRGDDSPTSSQFQVPSLEGILHSACAPFRMTARLEGILRSLRSLRMTGRDRIHD